MMKDTYWPKKVFILGGSGGMGSSIVLALIDLDIDVILGYKSNKDEAIRLQSIKPENISICHCDVNNPSIELFEMIHDIDSMVIASGQESLTNILSCTEKDLMDQYKLHVVAPLLLIQRIVKNGILNNILIISSTAAKEYNPNGAAYGLSKAGCNTLVKMLDKQLISSSVRVNAIMPGWCNTPMTTRILDNQSIRLDDILSTKINGEILYPNEIASLCLFLLSSKSKHIHGQIIEIDSPSK